MDLQLEMAEQVADGSLLHLSVQLPVNRQLHSTDLGCRAAAPDSRDMPPTAPGTAGQLVESGIVPPDLGLLGDMLLTVVDLTDLIQIAGPLVS